MEQVVLEVKDLKFKYRDAKKRVLNGLNFQVKRESSCVSSGRTVRANLPYAMPWWG